MSKLTRFDENSTSRYEWVHGRKPKGNGLYCFRLHQADGRTTDEWVSGTYTAAKKHALKVAEQRGGAYVSLQS